MPEETKPQDVTEPTPPSTEPVAVETPAVEPVTDPEPIVTPEPEPVTPPEIPETEPVKETQPEEIQTEPIQTTPPEQPTPVQTTQPQVRTEIVYQTPPNLVQNLLIKARASIQTRKRKKLDKILTLFEAKPHVTTKDVQKLLRTTKRTARRYFDQLETENRIKQVGAVGRGVFYEKIG